MGSEDTELAYNPCFFQRYEACRSAEDVTVADLHLHSHASLPSHMEEMCSALGSRFTWRDCRDLYFDSWRRWDAKYSLGRGLPVSTGCSGLLEESYISNGADLSRLRSILGQPSLAVPTVAMRSCHVASHHPESSPTVLSGGDWFQRHEFPPRKRVCVDGSDSPDTSQFAGLSIRTKGSEQ